MARFRSVTAAVDHLNDKAVAAAKRDGLRRGRSDAQDEAFDRAVEKHFKAGFSQVASQTEDDGTRDRLRRGFRL